MILWRVYIFILRLSAHPFLWLIGKAASPPICLHPHSGLAGIWQLGWFVLQCVFQTSWPFGKNLRIPIHSWWAPLQLSLSGAFHRRLRSCCRVYPILPAWYGLFYLYNLLGGFRYCCWVSYTHPLVWSFSLRLLPAPLFPVMTGYTKPLEGLIRSCKRIPRKYYLWLLCTLDFDREGFDGLRSFSLTVFLA